MAADCMPGIRSASRVRPLSNVCWKYRSGNVVAPDGVVRPIALPGNPEV
jgi:hypothetical protein